jgi:capsular polysaccharide biosynthesis protein
MDAPSRLPEGDARLFIGRTEGERRRIANFDEIRPVLAGHGFQLWSPGGLPFEKQMNVVAQARTIVAVHGAALSHIALRPPGSVGVIELMSSARPSPLFWELAESIGLRYTAMVGVAESGHSLAAFSVDKDAFEATVEAMLADEAASA